MRQVRWSTGDVVTLLNDSLVYPCTVVPSRYGGTYSGGRWLAFPFDPIRIPDERWQGGDTACAAFFGERHEYPIGRGATPSGAHQDLYTRLRDGLWPRRSAQRTEADDA